MHTFFPLKSIYRSQGTVYPGIYLLKFTSAFARLAIPVTLIEIRIAIIINREFIYYLELTNTPPIKPKTIGVNLDAEPKNEVKLTPA